VYKRQVDISTLEKLKGGSCRNVYRLNDTQVIKIAKSPKGLEQNLCANDYLLINEGILPKLEDVGLDYIITEYIPRNDKETRQFLKPLRSLTMGDFKDKTSKLQDTMHKLHLETLMDYNILWNDVLSWRNWGTRSNGMHVLIDEGAINDRIHFSSTPENWAIQEWEQIKRLRCTN
jgi:hypothetical protein